MGYILSVVIPTRNRRQYAKAAIDQVLAACTQDVQVVVCDNSDTNCLCQDIVDSRVKYAHFGGDVSFSNNFSNAIRLADGEYVCFIGDDDGVLPHIETVAQCMRSCGISAVLPTKNPPSFYWPNGGASGFMVVPQADGSIRRFSPRQNLSLLLRNGCLDYLSFDLVRSYHGIVHRSCFERVKAVSGNYFGGLSPDIYSAVALSLGEDMAVVTGFPVTIAGVCPKSGSDDSRRGVHTGSLSDAPHFRGNAGYCWSEMVPRFYSVETIWADSAIRCLLDMNEPITDFNEARLAARCLYTYKNHRADVCEYISEQGIKNASLLKETLIDCSIRLKRYLNNRTNGRNLSIYDVTDIQEAAKRLVNMQVLSQEEILGNFIQLSN